MPIVRTHLDELDFARENSEKIEGNHFIEMVRSVGSYMIHI